MYYYRPPAICDVPLKDNVLPIDVSAMLLRFSEGQRIDLGELCYIKRDYVHLGARRRSNKPTRGVIKESFRPERVEAVKCIAQIASDLLDKHGQRPISVLGSLTAFVAFVSWADSSGYDNVLESEDACRSCVAKFVDYQVGLVIKGALKNNTAYAKEGLIKQWLIDLFGNRDLFRGIRFNSYDNADSEPTSPPDETEVARELSLCGMLFDSLSKFVTGKPTYPHAVNLPAFVPGGDKPLWLFPSRRLFASHSELDDEDVQRATYDYTNGRIKAREELIQMHLDEGRDSFAARNATASSLRFAEDMLDRANRNPHHVQTLELAHRAKDLFIKLFLADTGMNWSTLCELPYDPDCEVIVERQAFRIIKPRAGYANVTYEVSFGFMRRLKQYYILRKYLDAASPSDKLFPSGNKSERENSLYYCGASKTSPVIRFLRRIYPSLIGVSPREYRAAKSDYVLSTADVATAAIVLQNTVSTVEKHYSAGTESKHFTEMGAFLNKLSQVVIGAPSSELAIPCAVGVCLDYSHPVQVAPGPVADCRKAEGCLFCDNYKVHADETDTRKLLSCRFCVIKSLPVVGTGEKYQATVVPILERIDEILGELSEVNQDLVARIKHEVEVEGLLDDYWSSKLDMLMELNIV